MDEFLRGVQPYALHVDGLGKLRDLGRNFAGDGYICRLTLDVVAV